MHRFFSPSSNISGDKIIIADRNQVHHLRDVLRFKGGDEIIIFDDKSNEYNCSLEKILAQSAILKIKNKHKFIPSPKTKITVACAIPKKSKMDEIVDKLTQLGVDRIIPLNTEHVITKLDRDARVSRLKRWQRIALSASLQSQRSQIPVIEPIKEIEEVLSESESFDLKLIPTLKGERKLLKDILDKSHLKNILALIGPEGDFTPDELDLAKKTGCIPVSLGDLVLRVETAAIAVVSFIKLYANR